MIESLSKYSKRLFAALEKKVKWGGNLSDEDTSDIEKDEDRQKEIKKLE